MNLLGIVPKKKMGLELTLPEVREEEINGTLDQWCSTSWIHGPNEWHGAHLWAGFGPGAQHYPLPAPCARIGPWEPSIPPFHALRLGPRGWHQPLSPPELGLGAHATPASPVH